MSQTIYKMFTVRTLEAFRAIPKDAQNDLLSRVAATLGKVGGKSVIMCDSAWSSEQWPTFGVEEYPSLEALQEHTKLLNELDWFRYVESSTLIGSKINIS